MTRFVLVHGAWHGPWAWDRITPLLHEAAAHTHVPELTAASGADLSTHVDQVLAALDGLVHGEDARRADDVVLVGHSYAGLVVRQAADLRPHLVDHVILVDGWAGPDGTGMFDLAPPAFVTAIRTAARPGGDGPVIPPPPPAAFGITDPVDAELLAGSLRPHPLRTFTDRTRLIGAVDRIPGTAIYCRPQTYPFDRLAADIGYAAVGLDGPHDVMLTHPARLARLLIQICAAQSSRNKG
ncbi:esterase/lipase family protein [Nocardia sp. NBC_01009]|uniref:esterase/lipase family protein n=1 Tax=Nocardia sp. NBC_01009 TaxID=2975996 RepID=UPI003870D58E|nr:alpha/beta fold hydrolase [Nocardia sp. NBC_01009]